MNAAAEEGGHGAERVKTLQLIAVDADAEAPCLPEYLPNGCPVLLPVRRRRGEQRVLKAAAFFVWHKVLIVEMKAELAELKRQKAEGTLPPQTLEEKKGRKKTEKAKKGK